MGDPRALPHRHPVSRVRALARLTTAVTEHPWALSRADLDDAHANGIDDAGVLHAILQAALFGHLNRMADAVGVDCDYPDSFGAPHQEPETPHYPHADASHRPHEAQPIDLALHAGAVERMGSWQRYVLERDTPLTRHERNLIASAVAARLGDAFVKGVAPETALERALVELSDIVTRAPWRLGPAAFAPVRHAGLPTDEDIFDAVATASSCTVFSRVRVALAAIGQ